MRCKRFLPPNLNWAWLGWYSLCRVISSEDARKSLMYCFGGNEAGGVKLYRMLLSCLLAMSSNGLNRNWSGGDLTWMPTRKRTYKNRPTNTSSQLPSESLSISIKSSSKFWCWFTRKDPQETETSERCAMTCSKDGKRRPQVELGHEKDMRWSITGGGKEMAKAGFRQWEWSLMVD